MAAAPKWKVYMAGEYRASVKLLEDAAILVAGLGEGAEVRFSHSKKWVVWTEGAEEFSAADSYDNAATIMHERCQRLLSKKRK